MENVHHVIETMVQKDILYKTPQEFGRFKHIVNTLDHEIETTGVVLYER